MSKEQSKTMMDALGNEVPLKYVCAYDKTRDKLVRRILARWQKMRAALEACMAETLGDIRAIQDARQLERGEAVAEKGNFTVTAFDGLVEVSVDQSYTLRLDDRAIAARDAMLAYAGKLAAKVGGADGAALMELINAAFSANAAGNLSVARVVSLCKRSITAKEWTDARDALLAAMQPERGKAYIRVRVRTSRQHDWVAIKLDSANCWPVEAVDGEEVA